MARDFRYKTRNPKDPDGPLIDVVIPGDLIDRYYKYSEVRYQNLRCAKFVLDNVQRIFSGIREFSNKGGWCHTARPEEWHVRPNVVAPFPPHLVFAVYMVYQEHREPHLRLYECRAEPVDKNDDLCPREWSSRFGGLIWKATS